MSTMNLTGLNVLLCRPEQASNSLQDKIIAAGGQCLHIPCMEIAQLEEAAAIAAIKSRVMDLDQYAFVIFISQNAVKYAEPWIDQYWPQLPMGQRYLAIGAATAAAARAMAFTELSSAEGAMDSEALLELEQLQDLSDKKILIFRGKGGREQLAQTLGRRGAKVDYCELYSRIRPAMLSAALAGSQFSELSGRNVILVHSGESLENLHHGIEEAGLGAWLSYPLICPSLRVANMAESLGFEKVLVASNAGEPAMLEALSTLVS
ncbi:MAG: uroporphyrinogen-III synthase [Cellvibrionaceae bacterium]|nr:uroporphyrinogen-III synthase [Cellvibrionaceae bacterium]